MRSSARPGICRGWLQDELVLSRDRFACGFNVMADALLYQALWFHCIVLVNRPLADIRRALLAQARDE